MPIVVGHRLSFGTSPAAPRAAWPPALAAALVTGAARGRGRRARCRGRPWPGRLWPPLSGTGPQASPPAPAHSVAGGNDEEVEGVRRLPARRREGEARALLPAPLPALLCPSVARHSDGGLAASARSGYCGAWATEDGANMLPRRLCDVAELLLVLARGGATQPAGDAPVPTSLP